MVFPCHTNNHGYDDSFCFDSNDFQTDFSSVSMDMESSNNFNYDTESIISVNFPESLSVDNLPDLLSTLSYESVSVFALFGLIGLIFGLYILKSLRY